MDNQKKVLIVEDEKNIVDILRRLTSTTRQVNLTLLSASSMQSSHAKQ